MQETRVCSLSREDPLEKEMTTYSSTLAWRILWTEEPGGLQSMGSQESDMTLQLNHHRPPVYNLQRDLTDRWVPDSLDCRLILYVDTMTICRNNRAIREGSIHSYEAGHWRENFIFLSATEPADDLPPLTAVLTAEELLLLNSDQETSCKK